MSDQFVLLILGKPTDQFLDRISKVRQWAEVRIACNLAGGEEYSSGCRDTRLSPHWGLASRPLELCWKVEMDSH